MNLEIALHDKVSEPAKHASHELKELGRSSHEAKEGVEKLEKETEKVKDILAEAREVGKEAIGGLKSGLKSLGSGDIAGGIEGVTESIGAMVSLLNLVVPGLGQAAKAAVEFAGGLAAIAVEGGERVLEATGALSKMETQLDALAGSSGKTGEQTLLWLDEVSEKLPQTRDKLVEWAKPLMAAGIQGEALESKLVAMSSATALLGDEGKSAFDGLTKKIQAASESGNKLKIPAKGLAQLAMTGVNVNEVAKEMGISGEALGNKLKHGTVEADKFGEALDRALIKKGGPAVAKASKGLGALGDKAKENFDKLFAFGKDDPKGGMDRFKSGLASLAHLIDGNTDSGKALHKWIVKIYDKFFEMAGNMLPKLEHGFLKIIIAGLRIELALIPLSKSLHKLGVAIGATSDSSDDLDSGLESMTKWIITGVDWLDTYVKRWTAVVNAVNSASTALDKAGEKVGLGAADSKGKGEGGLGQAVGGGIIGGAKEGALDAATGGLYGVIKNVSHLTGHASGGLVTDVGGGLATVQAAPGEGLTSIGKGERIVPAGGGSGGSGLTINVMPGAVMNHGVGSSGQAIEMSEESLSLIMEQLALKQGLGEAA